MCARVEQLQIVAIGLSTRQQLCRNLPEFCCVPIAAKLRGLHYRVYVLPQEDLYGSAKAAGGFPCDDGFASPEYGKHIHEPHQVIWQGPLNPRSVRRVRQSKREKSTALRKDCFVDLRRPLAHDHRADSHFRPSFDDALDDLTCAWIVCIGKVSVRFLHHDQQRTVDSTLTFLSAPKKRLINNLQDRRDQTYENGARHPRQVQDSDGMFMS